jgi:hypothetical protein
MEYLGMKKYRATIGAVLFYLFVSKIVHTMLVTSITSFVLMTSKAGSDLPNTVNEIASQYVFFSYAIGALLVSTTLWFGNRALYYGSEFWNEGDKKFWQLSRETKGNLWRGAGSAALLVLLLLALFYIAEQVTFLGLFITSAIGTDVFPLFLLDFISLLVLVVCEEYFFRYRLLGRLSTQISQFNAALVSTVVYILVKWVQFDLTYVDISNLFLLQMAMCFYFLGSGSAHRSLSFLAVFYGILHPIAGLPLWNQIGPSFFLFKHNAAKSNAWLTGADAGPLAGFGMSGVLVLLLIGSLWSWREQRS